MELASIHLFQGYFVARNSASSASNGFLGRFIARCVLRTLLLAHTHNVLLSTLLLLTTTTNFQLFIVVKRKTIVNIV